MGITEWAAAGVAAFFLVVAAFQVALAAGAPWGHAAYGGQQPGTLPVNWRVNSAAAAVALPLLAFAVLRIAGLDVWSPFPYAWGTPVLVILLVFLAAQAGLNALSPSRFEKTVWAQASAVAFGLLLIVLLTS